MKEGFATHTESPTKSFVYPDIRAERAEFERTAETFAVDAETLMFIADEEGSMVPLSEEVWNKLQNTDSNTLKVGNWQEVGRLSREYDRDWVTLKEKLQQGEAVDAPIIMKHGDSYHLVAGNTRLMIARALGETPHVLLFEYTEDRTNGE